MIRQLSLALPYFNTSIEVATSGRAACCLRRPGPLCERPLRSSPRNYNGCGRTARPLNGLFETHPTRIAPTSDISSSTIKAPPDGAIAGIAIEREFPRAFIALGKLIVHQALLEGEGFGTTPIRYARERRR